MADIRNAQGVLGQVVRQLAALNRHHPWSHNDHFHGWILRRLPDRREQALDVGCGHGGLVESLAGRFSRVSGVDCDAAMVSIATGRFVDSPQVTIRQMPFDEVTGSYDLITMVAVLHHLDVESALRRIDELLADGGRLLVVGLARVATPRDLIWDLLSAVLNPVVGIIRHPRRADDSSSDPAFPVRDPALTFDEVKAVALRMLPGVRMRRRLFFRYTLDWTKGRKTPRY